MVLANTIRKSKIDHDGATLVETVIVIVIVGILSSLGIGTYKAIQDRIRINALTTNVYGWIETVRKASMLGAGCTARINKDISSTGTIATSTLTAASSTSIERNCAPLLSTQNFKGSLKDGSTFEIEGKPIDKIMDGDQTVIQFTPRGTVVMPADTPQIDIVLTLMPSGPKRCISIKNLIGQTTISNGDTCEKQERF